MLGDIILLLKKALLGLLWVTTMTACQALRPYEKEYLVHPLMDDAMVRRLDARLMMSQGQIVEKLGGGVGGSGGGISCPTCGG